MPGAGGCCLGDSSVAREGVRGDCRYRAVQRQTLGLVPLDAKFPLGFGQGSDAREYFGRVDENLQGVVQPRLSELVGSGVLPVAKEEFPCRVLQGRVDRVWTGP